MHNDTTLIYVLRDPRDNAIRYVGITTKSLAKRLQRHCYTARRGEKTHKARWIRVLLNLDLLPTIEVIETDGNKEREIFWITHYRACGVSLTNSTDGGDGLRNPTPELRARISAANLGKKMSADAIARTAAAHRGSKRSAETCARISAAVRGKRSMPRTKEWREHISAAHKGKVFSAESRQRMSDAQRAQPRDPARHKKMIATQRAKGAAITHCPQGHEYNDKNTYRFNVSSRRCRICARDRACYARAQQRARATLT